MRVLVVGTATTACGDVSRDDQPALPPGLPALTEGGTGGSTTADTGEQDDDGQKLDVQVGDTDEVGDDPPAGTCEAAAMAESNQGCEFWAVDLPNAWAGINGSPSPAEQQFAVVVANTASDLPANVDVFRGDGDASIDSASVAIGEIHEFRLPALSQEPRANTYDGQAYRIESDVPITAYQFNPLDNTVQVYSNDASLLFPTHVLDTDYTAVTGDSIRLSTDQEPNGDNSGAFVSVVAIEDGTTVDLFATWNLYPGASQGVVLDRGQVFTAVSQGPAAGGAAGDGNLSGSRVVADRPVAVFSGNVATIEPNPGQCCADHLEQQMLPLVAWGDGYAAAPPPSPLGGSVDNPAGYRITGSFDGTPLSYSPAAPPGAPATINAGQTVRFQTDRAFTVTSGDPDRPFAITQFLLSNQIIEPLFGQAGDPAMISVPAVAQFQTTYVFLVPAGYQSNFVTVMRVAGTEVLRDGVSVSAANWRPLGNLEGVDYEYVALSVPTGSHIIESDEPCGIISVGYDTDVSYGYPGGSGLKIISEPPPPPAG